MDSNKIEKADRKFIDELPQFRSKLSQRQKAYAQRAIKKEIHLPLVQIIAPILIVAVGVVVIYLLPDKLPAGSQPKDAQDNTAQVPQPQAAVRFAPSVAASDKNSLATGQEENQRLESLEKTPLGNTSIVHANKVKTETGNTSQNRGVAEARLQDADEKQIALVSAVVCEGVQDHQPMVEKHAFSTVDSRRVYVWMEVQSKSQPFVINHNYYLNGKKYSEVPLQIKYPRMRTWSYVTIDKPDHIGNWRVQIVRNDSILKTVEFQVSAGAK
jgi:hypothetical protein